MNNDSDTATNEAPLTWTRSKQQGSEGMTYRAEITIDGNSYNFIVDSPRKGYWTTRGWNGGTFTLYREARTMKDAKAQAQAYADQVARMASEAKARKAERQDAPDITGTLPDGRAFTADHKASESEDVAQLSSGLIAADPADVVRPFAHMTDQLNNYMPGAVHRAAKAMRQFDWHLRRGCTCPTPSHRMSCGEGGKVTVVR